MHSSVLQGSDFEIFVNGRQQDHADFFRGWTNTARLGFVAPGCIDGVGAVNLIMAYVTAFYDAYRATGEDFFAYPDFYAFQGGHPLASYAWFDIWPDHKSVSVADDPAERLTAVTDRGVNVLILPDGTPTHRKYNKVQLASAQRNLDKCYMYSFDGQVKHADVTIRGQMEPFCEWVKIVFDTYALADDSVIQARKFEWFSLHKGKAFLEQSFRRVNLEEALSLL